MVGDSVVGRLLGVRLSATMLQRVVVHASIFGPVVYVWGFDTRSVRFARGALQNNTERPWGPSLKFIAFYVSDSLALYDDVASMKIAHVIVAMRPEVPAEGPAPISASAPRLEGNLLC